MGGAEIIPATIQGSVLISAGDLSGCEWPSSRLNPYTVFQPLQSAESIDDRYFVHPLVLGVRAALILLFGAHLSVPSLTYGYTSNDPGNPPFFA